MKFIELNKKLKEKVEHVYNIVGEDIFLVKQAITNLKSALVLDLEEFNYVKLDADKMKKEEALVNLEMLPMGNDYRLVVLVSPNADVVKFVNTYDFEDSSTIVACVNAEKLQNAEIIDCTKLDRADITKYVLHNLSKVKLSIQEQALDYLIDATNGDMAKIVNELNKLVSYALDEELITMSMVTNLVANSNEYAIYTLTNAIDNKDFAAYQKVLSEMSKTLSRAEVFSYMGKYFKRMQYVALNKNDEELSKILSLKPYAIKMSRQNVAKNGIKYYINLYDKYVELDYKIKSGQIAVKNALYELIF